MFRWIIYVCLVVTCVVGAEDDEDGDAVGGGRPLLVVSFDGFGQQLIDQYQDHLPNFQRLKNDGASVESITGAFPSLTSVSHHAIVTGTHPETNGVVLNYLRDPDYPYKTLNSSDEVFWKYNADLEPIWVLNERQGSGRHSGVMMWPGCEFFPSTRMQRYDKSLDWETRVDTVLQWMTDESEPVNLAFLYIDEPDDSLHVYGPNAPEILPILKKVDELVGYILDKFAVSQLADSINIMFMSDHGFAECVFSDRIIKLSQIIPNSMPYTLIGRAGVRHVHPRYMSQAEKLYQLLLKASNTNHFSVYRKDDLPDAWHYKDNRRVQPVVIVPDESYVYEDAVQVAVDWDRKAERPISLDNPHGCHGYDPSLPSMQPFFYGHGPSFRSGLVGQSIDSVDLYPLMCNLAGIAPGPNNGTAANTSSLLVTTSEQDFWLLGLSIILILLTITVVIYATIMCMRRSQEEKRQHMSISYEQCATVETRT